MPPHPSFPPPEHTIVHSKANPFIPHSLMRREPTLIIDYASRGVNGGIDTVFLVHPPLNPIGLGDPLRFLYVDDHGRERVYNVQISQLRVLEEHAVEFVAHLCCPPFPPITQPYVFVHVERQHVRLQPAFSPIITFLCHRPWKRHTIALPPSSFAEHESTLDWSAPFTRTWSPFHRFLRWKRPATINGEALSADNLRDVRITTTTTMERFRVREEGRKPERLRASY
ncbi:hypothetical protein PYCCODRAFT_1439394 [Trametes coccinea BRFM310]|uniref:Uncharacterized protein n=1 Tax=Trametes coccinea (strain BRFM310) TaxID=1353009 RepID=A0A1Y2ICF8_TRAC3|nr:hypothetical protein PYCCODRAFT_1439394 [Trametes coccinea BRFM310]